MGRNHFCSILVDPDSNRPEISLTDYPSSVVSVYEFSNNNVQNFKQIYSFLKPFQFLVSYYLSSHLMGWLMDFVIPLLVVCFVSYWQFHLSLQSFEELEDSGIVNVTDRLHKRLEFQDISFQVREYQITSTRRKSQVWWLL
ncbi:uncharacterized protein LOC105639606 isoform X5 [Jatropha curcas]|uniref:uncharacterized protein LOC105639606 isoform X5 n=1 Tax=Jatropha curcas TaxID=180498 RepID=UPI0009D6E456|nr:uncharacterized protein LOC105639606 isoform X5 [Jatropha curcas]